MRDPGLSNSREVPAFEVFLDGEPVPPQLADDLLAVDVSDYVEGASTFSLSVNIWDPETCTYKWVDDLFREGREVEVRMGYAQKEQSEVLKVRPLIRGEIVGLDPHYEANRTPVLQVRGYDLLHRTYRGRQTRTFANLTDSQIAQQIARELGLREEVEATGIVHPYLCQNNLSDLGFLRERARRIGFEVNIADGCLRFRSKPIDKAAAIELEYGETLTVFHAHASTVGQVGKTVVRGWDPMTKQAIVTRADSGKLTSRMEGRRYGAGVTQTAFSPDPAQIVDIPVTSMAEARQIAEGRFANRALGFIRGEAEAIGTPVIRAGTTVRLMRLGRRFSGDYYALSSTHRIDARGYTTKFLVERCAT